MPIPMHDFFKQPIGFIFAYKTNYKICILSIGKFNKNTLQVLLNSSNLTTLACHPPVKASAQLVRIADSLDLRGLSN
jgi:hypothetical protein